MLILITNLDMYESNKFHEKFDLMIFPHEKQEMIRDGGDTQ